MRPCVRRSGAARRAGSSRSSNGLAVTLTVSSSLTRRTPWPMPQAARARAAMSQPRSRAGRACDCNMPCPMPASSMCRPPVPRRCRTSPTPSGSGCGAAKTSLSPHALTSWPRLKMAVSQPWRCWPAILRRSASTLHVPCHSTASNMTCSSTN